jgi:hypothetical protein
LAATTHHGVVCHGSCHGTQGLPNGAQINYPAAFAHLSQLSGGLQPFAIVKLTEVSEQNGGLSIYVNPYAAADVAGFKAAGCAVAGYHFVHGNTTA